MKFFHKLSDNNKSIYYAILTCFYVSIMIGIVRHLSKDFHTFYIIMMRNFFAFLFFMPFIIKSKAKIFHTKKLNFHILRGLNGFAGMALWFYTITLIAMPEAISITFAVPIITSLAAMFFLKEKVPKNIWISLVVGIIGILIIIRPGFKEFKSAYLLAFLTTFLWAASSIMIKKMTKTEKIETITAYTTLIILIISIPFGIFYIKPLNYHDLFWFVMVGLFSNLAHISMSNCYAKADLHIAQPFDFLRLIFTSIIAYFFFDEVIDFYTFLGSLIIFFGVIFSTPKRAKIQDNIITLK